MLVSSAGIAGFAGGALFAPEKMDETFLNEEARCAKNEVPYSFMGHALGTCHAHAHVFICIHRVLASEISQHNVPVVYANND